MEGFKPTPPRGPQFPPPAGALFFPNPGWPPPSGASARVPTRGKRGPPHQWLEPSLCQRLSPKMRFLLPGFPPGKSGPPHHWGGPFRQRAKSKLVLKSYTGVLKTPGFSQLFSPASRVLPGFPRANRGLTPAGWTVFCQRPSPNWLMSFTSSILRGLATPPFRPPPVLLPGCLRGSSGPLREGRASLSAAGTRQPLFPRPNQPGKELEIRKILAHSGRMAVGRQPVAAPADMGPRYPANPHSAQSAFTCISGKPSGSPTAEEAPPAAALLGVSPSQGRHPPGGRAHRPPAPAGLTISLPETKSELVNELHGVHTPRADFKCCPPGSASSGFTGQIGCLTPAGWTVSLPETKSQLVNEFHQLHTPRAGYSSVPARRRSSSPGASGAPRVPYARERLPCLPLATRQPLFPRPNQPGKELEISGKY
ncbi:hypothetical protein CRENBAI_005576 [Crenichthys baileyi]|uniref:Basic proline-rich protein-like n=1 Tax=Crenichthys baileyi TaxID=28760 RepID=A0AAV9SFG2_9TELE